MKKLLTLWNLKSAWIALLVPIAATAESTVYKVNTLADTVAEDGKVSLREAILAANRNEAVNEAPAGSASGMDRVTFDVEALRAEAGEGNPLVITLNGTELKIEDHLAILGPGRAVLTIDGAGLSRLLHADSKTLELSGLRLTGGQTNGHGAAIYGRYAELRLADLLIEGNRAYQGGAIATYGGSLELRHAVIRNNVASYMGGGLSLPSTPTTLVSVAVVDNRAYYGGAAYLSVTNITMRNVTVAGNFGNYATGGFYGGSGSSARLENTIFAENGEVEFNLPTVALNSILSDGVVAFMQLPDAGPDGVWGTADDVPGDYRLQATSVGVDMGDDALVQEGDLVDADGRRRRVNGRVDIGAYEVQTPVSGTEAPSTLVTTLLDIYDRFDGETSLREAIAHAAFTEGATVTFDPALGGETIALDSALVLYGTLNLQAPAGGLTLDAGGNHRVLEVKGVGTEATLDGFTLTNGYASGNGGGALVNGGRLTLLNATVSGNQSNDKGGGIYVTDGSLTVEHSTIASNAAKYGGGGIYSHRSPVTIRDTLLESNTTSWSGGAAIQHFGNQPETELLVENSILRQNSGDTGAIYLQSAALTLAHCEIVDNVGRFNSAAVYLNGGNATIRQTTIAGNQAYGSWGRTYPALHFYHTSGAPTLRVENSIIAGNETGDIGEVPENVVLTVNSSLIGIDPGFKDPDNGDYTLAPHSPAIGRGTGAAADIGGHPFTGVPGGGDPPSAVVTTLADTVNWQDGQTSLREAILFATLDGIDAGVVTFDAALAGGTIALTQPLGIYDSVTLTAPTGSITLDAGQVGRIIDCPATDTTLALTGFTLTGGNAAGRGGAIRLLRGNLQLKECAVLANTASSDGGALYANAASVTVDSCAFSENRSRSSSSRSGGAIYSIASPITVNNSSFTDNSSGSHGGAIYADSAAAAVTIADSLFEDNAASSAGGAISAHTLSADNTIFRYNSGSQGGALYNNGSWGRMDLYRVHIFRNRASSHGGGLFLSYACTANLAQTAITENVSGASGGGIYASQNTMTLLNSTVAGNLSNSAGGGIWCTSNSILTLRNSVVAANIHLPTQANDLVRPNNTTLLASFIGTDDGAPGFVQLPTAGEDGIWDTEDDTTGDYHPLAGSPLHNGGDSSLVADGMLDLDGYPRVRGASVDIGAYERTQLAVQPIADQIMEVDTLFERQFVAVDADLPHKYITITWQLGEDAPSDAVMDPITGILSWAPMTIGTWPITVIATDGILIASTQFHISVLEEVENLPPVFQPIGDLTVDELTPIAFTIKAEDPNVENVPISFALEGSVPLGVALDAATGAFSWTPSEAQGPGSYLFTVTATEVRSDGKPPLSSSLSFTIHVREVNTPPVLTLPTLPVAIDEQQTFSFIAGATDADIPGNPLTFWLVDAPDGASINRLTGEFIWTPTERQGPGSYTFSVQVFDGLATDSQTVTLQVREVNRPPTIPASIEKTVQGSSRLYFHLGASDPDIVEGDTVQTLSYSLIGPQVPAGATISSSGYFDWTPTALQTPGEYIFDVVVSDGEFSATCVMHIHAILPPDLTVAELDLPAGPLLEGQALRLRGKIANISDGDLLQAARVGLYINGSHATSTWLNAAALPAGQYTWVEFIWNATPGVHTVEIRADDDSRIAEIDETNNALSGTLPEVGFPDLMLTDFSYTPEQLIGGTPVQFNAHIANAGHGTTRDVLVLLTADGREIGRSTLRGPFAADRAELVQFSWTALPGDHEIVCIVDPHAWIADGDRTNNSASIILSGVEDTVPPVFDTVIPGEGQRMGGIFAVSASATDQSPLAGFTVELLGGDLDDWLLLHSAPTCAFDWDTTILADGEYLLRFRVSDSEGNIAQLIRSITVDNTPPMAVTLTAQAIEFGAVLSWDMPLDPDFAHFRMFRATSADGPFNQINGALYSAGFTDRKLDAGTEYFYLVRTFDLAGNVGPDSNLVAVTPLQDQSPPVINDLLPKDGSVHTAFIPLHVQAVDNIGVTAIRFAYALEPAGAYDLATLEWTLLQEGTEAAFSWDVSELPTGRYLVRVTVEDAMGLQAQRIKTYLVDNKAPDAVGTVRVERRELALAVGWNMPLDTDVTGYRLSRNADGGEFIVLSEHYTSTLYVDRRLQPGVLYAYRVEAIDQVGLISEPSQSIPVAALDDTTAPVLLALSPLPNTRVSGIVPLSLRATDNDALAHGSFWYRAVGDVNWNDCGGDVTLRWLSHEGCWQIDAEWDTSGLADGSYDLLARATDTAGNSLEATFTLVIDTVPPTSPTNLSVSDSQTGVSVVLTWDANGESDLAGYHVFRRIHGQTEWQFATTTTQTELLLDALTSGQQYEFAISAVDTAGNVSPLSNVATVTPSTFADIAIQRIAFLPTNPTRERLGQIEARLFNNGPARAQAVLHFFATVDGVESHLGQRAVWIHAQETLYVTLPWIPQSTGLTGIRVLAEVIAPAIDPNPANNTLTLETIVNAAPVPIAGPDRSCNWYEPVLFDASGSYDPDGRIMDYRWDFGDGKTARGAQVTHKYDTIGLQTAQLTVTDDRGVSTTTTVLVNVADTRADLVVSDITWLPGEPQEGDEITITATIRNVGNGPTKKHFFVTYYINGVYNGYVVVDQLIEPGAAVQAVVKWVATSGLHTVRIVADDLINSINEIDETNNDRQVSMTFQQVHFPDLQVTGLSCPLPEQINSQNKVTVTVDSVNAGTGDAKNVFLALYLNGSMIARKPLTDMPAGATASTTFDVLLGEGHQVLMAMIDGPISLVVESDETNNTRTLDLGELSVVYPDLSLALRVLPEETELAHRSWIDLQATVHNNSSVDVQQTAQVTFYANGRKVGMREIRYLGAGGRETVAFQIPATPGTHELRAVVNEDKSIVETDYSNNAQSHTTGDLHIVYCDLAVSNLSWQSLDGSLPAFGKDLLITFDISNLSVVSSFDKTSIVLLVDGDVVDAMEIGSIRGYETISTGLLWKNVSVDPNVPHTVAVQIDPANLIPEQDKSNNIAIAAVPLNLEDGLILTAEVDRPDDEYFGIPLYFSRESCRLTAKVSRASAPTAWLDNNEGRSMTVSLNYQPGVQIQPDGSAIYPDPVAIYDNEPMIFDPLTGEFRLAVALEALLESGNYSLSVHFSDGAESRSRAVPILVVQDCNFTLQLAEDSVIAGERIHISGQVLDLADNPMAGEKVLLSIFQGSEGFGNSLNPVLEGILGIAEDVTLVEVMTGLDGTFSSTHRTFRGQSGNYTIRANVISSIVGAEAIADFEILNAGFDGPGVLLTLPKNYAMAEAVTLTNRSGRALTNVQVQLVEKTAAAGLDVRLLSGVPGVLGAGASVSLSVVFDAVEQAEDFAEYELLFSCAEGITDSYIFKVHLKESTPHIRFDPNLLEVALNPGVTLFRSITARNNGLGTLRGLRVIGTPNLPWVTIANPGVTSLAANEAVTLELMIKPGAGTGLGLYRDFLTLEDGDGQRYRMPVQIELTSATRSGVAFMVQSDTGQWLDQAEVRLISKATRPVIDPDGTIIANRNDVFIEKTDLTGRVLFEDVPTGEYSYSILRSGYATKDGTVEVMPSSLPLVVTEAMVSTPITYEWSVTPITIEDRYEITLNIGMNLTGLMRPELATIPPWATIAQQVQTGYNDRIVFKNVGDYALYDVRVEVVSKSGLEERITLAGNGNVGTVAANEVIYLNYYVPEGDYSDVTGSSFTISGTYINTTASGQREEEELVTVIRIYNPASETVTIRVPGLSVGGAQLPDLSVGDGGEFPKLKGFGDISANALVRLEIGQEATLEREGFEAVLTFRNGMADDLIGFSVAPRVFDIYNNDVTAAFQLVPPSLRGALSATDGSQNLPGGSEFTASWILVPGKGLGGEDPAGQTYFVEAVATYAQGGQLRTFQTQSEEIRVHPQPELQLFYYLPSEILANTPFRLGVFVENHGYGDASQFRIASAQPEIVENESGVPVKVEIVGSSFGAGNRETDSWTVELGDVAAQGWARGYWITRSNYDATVIDFSAELQHVPFRGVELNPLITAVHTEIILGDYLFADAIDPNNSFSLIDRDDDGIPDYLLNLHTGFRSAITVPSELRVIQEPTFAEPQMIFSIADTYGFVCMVIDDPLAEINVRGIERHHTDGSGDVFTLSGNNFWRDGRTLYIVDRIGAIVDGHETIIPVQYVIDYQPMLEVRDIQIGNFVFNTLAAGEGLDGEFIFRNRSSGSYWTEDLRGNDGIGVLAYGWLSLGVEGKRVPLYNTGLPIIAGDPGAVRVEFYNRGISPESGDVAIYLIDAEGSEALLATQSIVDLRPYRTLELEFPFETTMDGQYVLDVRFLDGRTEGSASLPIYINARPVADAGPDQIVARGQPVRFDSSRSYDPDGLLIKYEWYMGDFGQDDEGRDRRATWIASPTPTYTFNHSGTYRVLLAVTDYYGAMEEDEMVITVQEDRPDLFIASLSHGESTIVDGQLLTITVVLGNAAADLPRHQSFYVSLYAGDRLVDTQKVFGGLASGDTRTVTFSYTAKANDDFLTVVVDDMGSAIDEANKRNNIDTLAIFAESTEFADLITRNLRLSVPADQPVAWGMPIQILADISNSGEADATKPFRVTAYVNGSYLGFVRLDGLDKDVTSTVAFDWIPNPGIHTIEIIADWPYSYIRERDKTNNRASLVVSPANLDLRLPNISALALRMDPQDGLLTQGMSVGVTATFRNDSAVDLPFGSEAVLKVNGLAIARRSIGAVAAGRSAAVQFIWVNPWKGEHAISVELDPDGKWQESDKSDNTISQSYAVTFESCDLMVRQLSLPPGDKRVGMEIPLGIQMVNAGRGPTGRDFTAKVFVNDEAIAVTRVTGLLNPGQTRWWTPVWIPPAELAGTTATLRVELDTLNEVSESNEDNNTRTLSVVIAEGIHASLALNPRVVTSGEGIEATIGLIDTATDTPDAEALVELVVLADNGTEVRRQTASFADHWYASLATDALSAGDYQIRAEAVVDGRMYRSALQSVAVVDERIVSCEAAPALLLGSPLSISGRVTMADGSFEAGRTVAVVVTPSSGEPQFIATQTQSDGTFSVALHTTKALAGSLAIYAEAIGPDLKGLSFASSGLTTHVAGLYMEMTPAHIATAVSAVETVQITLEAIGADIDLAALVLRPEPTHPDADALNTLWDVADLPDALANGETITLAAQLWATEPIDSIPVELQAQFTLPALGESSQSTQLLFAATTEKLVEVACSDVRVYYRDGELRTIPWDELHHVHLVVIEEQRLFVDVTVTNKTDRPLYNVQFSDPGFAWIHLPVDRVDVLEPWGTWTIRVEIETFRPGIGRAVFSSAFEVFHEEIDMLGDPAQQVLGDRWPFDITFYAQEPGDVHLTCLLRDQYGNPLPAHHLELKPLATDSRAQLLLSDSNGLATAILRPGIYQYTVKEGSTHPYRDCTGELWVYADNTDADSCYKEITIKVDPFGLAIAKYNSTDLQTYGETRLGLVLESAEAPLKLSHPGREYLLLQLVDSLPDGYHGLIPGSRQSTSNQLSLMNRTGGNLSNLRVWVDGPLASYLFIDGYNPIFQRPMVENLIRDATHVMRWSFDVPALRTARAAAGADLLLDGTFLFTSDQGYEAIFHLRMRVSNEAATHNGSPYEYITYTDWMGRDCPVGIDTLPQWMGLPDGTLPGGSAEAGMMAGINQTILASGQSFQLEQRIHNRLPDQELVVENSQLRIFDDSGNEKSSSFIMTQEVDPGGQTIAPSGFVRAQWQVDMTDSSLGGTSAEGRTYTAVFEGATRYGTALIPYRQEIEFVIKPAPALQVNYSFEQTGRQTGVLTARVDNNGYGPASNVTMELPLISNAVLASGHAIQRIDAIQPGDTAIFTWDLRFSRPIYSTEVLAQLKSFNPMMAGRDGEWVKAPVTHEFRTEHTIAEVIAQLDDLINALENKVEYEFQQLMFLYNDIGDQLVAIRDTRQLELMSHRMNAIVNATFGAIDVFQKAKQLVTDATGLVKADIRAKVTEIGKDKVESIITESMKGTPPSAGSVMKDLTQKASEESGHNNMVELGNSVQQLNNEILQVITTTKQLAELHETTLLKFRDLYDRALANVDARPSAEEIRTGLFYQSVDTARFLQMVEQYVGEHKQLPLDHDQFDFIFERSRGQTVVGLSPFIESIRTLGRDLKSQLYILEQSKVSAIFPVDLLYNELRSMTAALVTYDVSAYAQNSAYERKVVETPALENPDNRSTVYWYAMGTSSSWLTPVMASTQFGEVQETLKRSYDHLVWQWNNISWHSELITQINYAYLQKLVFDSAKLISGYCLPGQLSGAVSPVLTGIQEALQMEIEAYQLGLRVANQSQATVFDLLCEDVRDFTAAHQAEAGSVWTFMRDFGGHLDYLIAKRPIDPELSVEVLSFKVENAVVPQSGGMGLSSGIVSLRNNGELPWSAQPVLTIFADGLKVQTLKLPVISMSPGEEGIIPMLLPQADGKVLGLFGYDYELTMELWEEQTLSRATCGPWVTSSQAGTRERLARLSPLGAQPLIEHSFTADRTVSQTYTATVDGALRFRMLHNAAAMMDLYVFDEWGNMAGFDYDLMDVVCEIPHAQFSGVDDRYQMVTIRNVEAGSQWLVSVVGVDANSRDRMNLSVTELPDVPASLFTINKEYRTVLNGTNAVITAQLREVGGTRGIDNLALVSFTDPETEEGEVLATKTLVFSFENGATSIPAGGLVSIGASIELADEAVDGLYRMELHVEGNDSVTGETVPYTLVFSIELDTTAPPAPTFALEQDVNYPDLVVASGMAEPGSTVEIWSTMDQMFIQIDVDAQGHYRSHPFGLQFGDYVLFAVAIDVVGNVSEPSATIAYNESSDWFPPQSEIVVSGTVNAAGIYLREVMLQLSATDIGSGVDYSKISFDQGVTWQLYHEPILLDTPGTHHVSYFSTDVAGNREQPKMRSFRISDPSIPPVLLPMGNFSVVAHTPLVFTVAVQDTSNFGNLTFSLLDAPAGAAIDPQTGVFSWTPTEAQAPASYTFMVQVADQDLSAVRDVTIMVERGGAAALWLEAHLPANTPAELRGLYADADFDGICNLVEYAMGLNPAVADAENVMQLTRDPISQAMELTIQCRDDDPALTYICMVSNDLLAWNEAVLTFDPHSRSWTSSSAIVEIVSATQLDGAIWSLRLRDNSDFNPVIIRMKILHTP